jgi:putative phosphoesterase
MTDSQSPIPASYRVAVLADTHGNTLALDAALAEIEAAGGVDAYWFLGDYVAIGFDPLGVMARISGLPRAVFVRGNTDRLATSLTDMDAWLAEVEHDLTLWPMLLRINRSFAWTAGAMASGGWLEWLSELPLELRFTLPDGTHVLLVHASPGTDDGVGIHPNLSDDELGRLVADAAADLIFIGHTHAPLDRLVEGVRVVNPGSIGNPVLPGAGACYALLEVDADGYRLTLHQAVYDKEAAMAAADAVKHPAADYIKQFLQGKRIPDWAKE